MSRHLAVGDAERDGSSAGSPPADPASADGSVADPETEPATERGGGDGGWATRLTAALVALPDRLLLIFLWTTVVVSLTLLFGIFYPFLVIPAIVIVVALTWRVWPTPLRADRQSAIGAVVALEIAAGWIQLNRHYRGELLSIARDPGVYTIRAWWLMSHPSPNVPVASAQHAVQGIASAAASAGGFPYSHGEIRLQGNSMVPGLFAMAGWFGHGPAMLQANVVLGALALLSVYTFGRRVLGPLWALAPMLALALSLPMIYFSRNTYTEPVALLVTFVGLTLMWSAWQARSNAQFLVAGLALGAAQLARIDGAVAVLGASIGIGLVAVLAVDPATRRRTRGHLIAFALGAGAMMAVGTLDLIVNSPPYILHQDKPVAELLAAFALAVIVLWLLSRFSALDAARRGLLGRRAGVARLAAVVAVLGVLVMLSRPLWFVGHFIRDPPINQMLQVYQQRESIGIDGTRSYDERTIIWLAWYLGWPLILVAACGMAWMLWNAVRTRRPQQVAFLTTFGVVATLYLNDVNITPIQIWAMRRLLPVVMPSLLVLGVWAAVRFGRRMPGLQWVSVAVVVGIAVLPTFSWNSLLTVGEENGEYGEVMSICAAIHGDRVVLIGDIEASGNYLPTVRVICGKQAAYINPASKADLAQISKGWGGGEITVLTFNATEVPWASPPSAPFHSGNYPSWPSPISSPPRVADNEPRSLWVGDLQPDGSVAPRAS